MADPTADCDWCGRPGAKGSHGEGWWSFRCDPPCNPDTERIQAAEQEQRRRLIDYYAPKGIRSMREFDKRFLPEKARREEFDGGTPE